MLEGDDLNRGKCKNVSWVICQLRNYLLPRVLRTLSFLAEVGGFYVGTRFRSGSRSLARTTPLFLFRLTRSCWFSFAYEAAMEWLATPRKPYPLKFFVFIEVQSHSDEQWNKGDTLTP